MKMHEMMQDYVKKERNKPLARSISAEMLEHTKAVVKKHTLGKGSYKYHLAQPARMLARAFQLWRKVILRKLKKKTSSRYPWTVRFSWNFPMEMFACLGVLCGHEPHTKAQFKRRISHVPNKMSPLNACDMRRLNQLNSTDLN